MSKVKIYGTLGPACSDPGILRRMFEEGMDGIRLNLSHTTLDDAADLISSYHKAAESCGVRDPELLIDMQGPELRIGRLDQPLLLEEGELIPPGMIPFPDAVSEMLQKASREAEDVSGGSHSTGREILLDDGKILLRTEWQYPARESRALKLRVIRGGILASRKSVALPGHSLCSPAMTAEDLMNIRKAKLYGVTAVMQPFVRGREDLEDVRRALDACGCEDIRLFAKIENTAGFGKLDELIPCCDEIVIARGDLGNSMELWELPAVQKKISAACRTAGRDFMVVTQMLDSMVHRQIPTRAEVSDIFNAVLDGASSVMVTGETASGEHPVLAIRYLARTVREAEKFRSECQWQQ